MSALDFLTGQTQPTNSQTYSQSSNSLPPWYQDYTNQILTKATQYANEPYQPYQGPRIASATPLTNDAYAQAGMIGSGVPGTQSTAQNLIAGAARGPTASNAGSPYLNTASNQVNGSIGPNQGGLAAANPYLSAAATPSYSNVQNYMNPYNTAVTDNIARLGNRQFNENTLPALNDQFVGAGNILGMNTHSADLAARAARDNNANILGEQAGVLQSGFSNAMGNAQQDASRLAGIGSTAGQLGTAGQMAQQNAGALNTNIGATAGNLADTSARTQSGIGSTLSNANAQGVNTGTQAIGTENAMGQQQQGQNQNNLNLAYQDFLNQKNNPLLQMQALQSGLSGVQVPTASQNYSANTGTGTGPSPMQQIGSLFTNYLSQNPQQPTAIPS